MTLDAAGQPLQAPTLYAYDAQGRRTVTAVDVLVNGQIDFDGADRIERTLEDVLPAGHPENSRGMDLRRTRTYV